MRTTGNKGSSQCVPGDLRGKLQTGEDRGAEPHPVTALSLHPSTRSPNTAVPSLKQGSQDLVKQDATVEKSSLIFSLLSTLACSTGSVKQQHHCYDHSLALVQFCGTQKKASLWQEPGGTTEQLDLPRWWANRMALFFHHSLKRHQILQFPTGYSVCSGHTAPGYCLFLNNVYSL